VKKIIPTSATKPQSALSRRNFLRSSSLVAAGAGILVTSGRGADIAPWSDPAPVTVKNKKPIRAVVIGVGGRGGGAGRDFITGAKMLDVDAQIVAVADLYPEQAKKAARNYKREVGQDIPDDKCFSGFDAYMKALEVPGVNYVILATPPGFRPHHFKAAIAAGKNVFMEKPVAVDGPGIRIVYAAYEESLKKNLKVAAGTQRRHRPSYIETIKRIKDGAIGEVTTLRAYWVNGSPIWHEGGKSRYNQKVGETDLEVQLNNWYHYIWLCGDHICEQHVHNIDVCNWIAGGHPVRAWGMGARQELGNKAGEIWDNFAVEFQYENGVRMHAYCGQVHREWSSVSEAVVGATGSAQMNDGRNSIKTKDGKTWSAAKLPGDNDNGYVLEHRDLIAAILDDKPLNEAKQVADSTLTAILGREAAYSGSGLDWNDVLNSKFQYGPDQLYTDASRMKWGSFRTLKPPMPSAHNIFANPPSVPTA
jgi:predicted dehydrogenase